MNRMQEHNLYNIKRNFEKKTGTRLISQGSKEETAFAENAVPRKRLPRVAMIAAIITAFFALTAFAVSIFSTWAGDSLTMTASYYGNGIVWVEISNQSDKDLKLEPDMKLYYYSTQELVESTDEEPYIENLTIPANSTEKVRLDLRRTYDVEALENSKNEFYYLQMTNDGFLIGQKWSCTVSFVVSDYVTPWYELTDDSCLEGVLPSLKAYYLNFTPDGFARWPDAYDYIELVQAELAKVDDNLVRTCGTPIYFDNKDWPVSSTTSSFDPYNKLMGPDDTENYIQISIPMCCPLDDGFTGGGWNMPILFLYQYSKYEIQSQEDYTFIRGNLLTFEEMEPYKVYDDGEYVVYEMHHLFYTDLHNYVQDMLLQRDDMYIDEQQWGRIERVYAHWSDKTNLQNYLYRLGEGKHRVLLTMPDVLRLAQKGEALTFEDIDAYRGGTSHFGIDDSEIGMPYTIDGNYELFYAQHIDGTLRGWHLIHTPSGDQIDIRYDNVEEFIKAHGDPLPRCACENPKDNSTEETHGWYITLEWLLKMGNDIVPGDLGYACSYRLDEDMPDAHITKFLIYENDAFYVEDSWSEENHKWMLWLVHVESGDRCDLQTEDAAAFVNAHGGVK